MPAGSPSATFLTVLVVIVVAAAGIGVGVLYWYNHPKSASAPTVVVVGDNVTVNYIGLFGSGPQEGKVFDTSIQSVAQDNATYPKSLQYTPRKAGGYTPLPVHVGPNTPSAGYNVSGVTYGGVVTGFWKGLIGLGVNQSRWVTVPPLEGYGDLNPTCLVTAPLVTTIPALVVQTPSQFTKAYPKVTEAAGVSFTDPTYGWTDRVLSVNATTVVVSLLPYAGETTAPYGWTELVTNVTTQQITLQSQLTPASVGSVLGSIANVTVCTSTKFLVWSVDLANGTFVENYNKEVAGVTLTFVVTIVSIVPP